MSYTPPNARNLRNILVNGSFDVWQRATSFVTPAQAAFTADMWKIDHSFSGGNTTLVARESTEVDTGEFSMKMDYTTEGSTTDMSVVQSIENHESYRGHTLSLSVRVKTSVANSAFLQMNDGVQSITSSKHTGGGGFETLTLTITIASASTSIVVILKMEDEGIVYWDSAMLAMSPVSVDFIPKTLEEEETACIRHYEEGRIDFNVSGRLGVTPSQLYFLSVGLVFDRKAATPSLSVSSWEIFEEGLVINEQANYTKNIEGFAPMQKNSARISVFRLVSAATARPSGLFAAWHVEVT